jgi:hypothetical protein
MDIKTLRDSVDVQVRMIMSRLYNCSKDLDEKQFIIKAVNIVSRTSGVVHQEVLRSGEFLFPNQWKRIKRLIVIL